MQTSASPVTTIFLGPIEPHLEHLPGFYPDPEADERLLRSTQRFGIIYPLLVVPGEEVPYRILDDHLRYRCAGEFGIAAARLPRAGAAARLAYCQ